MKAAFRADMVDEDQFAARLEHAHKFIECGLRVRHRGDDILRHHRVEIVIGKTKLLRVHHRE